MTLSITDYCRKRWHKFSGSQPTNDGDRRASLRVGWKDIATLANTSLYLGNAQYRHTVTMDESRMSSFERWQCWRPWVSLNPTNDLFRYIWAPFCISGAGEAILQI